MNRQIQSEKIWYSYMKRPYNGALPRYFESDLFSWVAELETDFDSIKKEVDRLINEHSELFVPYFNPELVDKQGSWKTLAFYFWSLRNDMAMNQSPILEKFFEQIPGFISAGISKLEAGAEIQWHTGDTSGIIRCHLPIYVPKSLPECGFQVEDEKRTWREGKMLLFCDAHRHKAFNFTEKDRVMLMIDVVNPIFAKKKKNIVANALSILWLQRILLKVNFPNFMKGAVRRGCLVFIYLYLPFKRNKKHNS